MTVSIHQQIICASPAAKRQSLWTRLHNMIAIARQRRQLLALDDHQLQDIGISRQDARAEAQQNMWNVPNHWRK